MTRLGKLEKLSTKELVYLFVEICVGQNQAMLYSDGAKVNRLIKQMWAIEDELKSRPGDQRRELLVLFAHKDAQVRLMAARANLAVAPEAAREMIEAIANGPKIPQAGDAGMTIENLDSGLYKPS